MMFEGHISYCKEVFTDEDEYSIDESLTNKLSFERSFPGPMSMLSKYLLEEVHELGYAGFH